MFNKPFFLAVISAVLMLTAAPVHAWDGSVSGKIGTLEVTHAGNFAVRIWLADNQSMCSSGAQWAYLNEGDSNYKVFVAALLMAKAQGSAVTVSSTNIQGLYCQIGHVVVRN